MMRRPGPISVRRASPPQPVQRESDPPHGVHPRRKGVHPPGVASDGSATL